MNALILLRRLFKNDKMLANNVQNSVKNVRRFLKGKKKPTYFEAKAIYSCLRVHQKDFFAKDVKLKDLMLYGK